MSNNHYGKRIEKKVATKTRAISHDVKRGINWAGSELVKNSETVGRDVKRGGKAVGRDVKQAGKVIGRDVKRAGKAIGHDVERGGKRIGAATHRTVTRASDRLKARRRARATKA